MMIEAATIDALRRQVERTMTETAVIERVTTSRDADGNLTSAWTPLATTVGKVGAPRVADETVLAGQLTGVVTFTVSLPVATQAHDTDRIVLGGRTYAIEGWEGPLTIELERRAITTLVEGL